MHTEAYVLDYSNLNFGFSYCSIFNIFNLRSIFKLFQQQEYKQYDFCPPKYEYHKNGIPHIYKHPQLHKRVM